MDSCLFDQHSILFGEQEMTQNSAIDEQIIDEPATDESATIAVENGTKLPGSYFIATIVLICFVILQF